MLLLLCLWCIYGACAITKDMYFFLVLHVLPMSTSFASDAAWCDLNKRRHRRPPRVGGCQALLSRRRIFSPSSGCCSWGLIQLQAMGICFLALGHSVVGVWSECGIVWCIYIYIVKHRAAFWRWMIWCHDFMRIWWFDHIWSMIYFMENLPRKESPGLVDSQLNRWDISSRKSWASMLESSWILLKLCS